MKRFYCTICNKMIRVRKMPVIIEHANDTMPEHRVGICNWHTQSGAYPAPNRKLMGILTGKGSK